jgi:8-oxo-dGTP diphosphatase
LVGSPKAAVNGTLKLIRKEIDFCHELPENKPNWNCRCRISTAIPIRFHEFPGGKCQTEEAADACAVRECREETGLEVIALKELLYQEHSYEHADVKLHFWLCRPVAGSEDLTHRDLQGFHWFPAERLSELRFPEANARLIELLVSTYASA